MKYFYTVFLWLILYTSFAQKLKISGLVASGSLGICKINDDQLNKSLKNNGYPDFSKEYVTSSIKFGGILDLYNQNFILSAEGSGFGSRDVKRDNKKGKLGGIVGLLNIGYILLIRDHYFISLKSGIGISYITVKEKINDNQTTYPSMLSSPAQTLEINNKNFFLNFSLNLNYELIKKGEEDCNKHVLLGINMGYRISEGDGIWKTALSDKKVHDVPEINITGPFIQITIGGGKIKYIQK